MATDSPAATVALTLSSIVSGAAPLCTILVSASVRTIDSVADALIGGRDLPQQGGGNDYLGVRVERRYV